MRGCFARGVRSRGKMLRSARGISSCTVPGVEYGFFGMPIEWRSYLAGQSKRIIINLVKPCNFVKKGWVP